MSANDDLLGLWAVNLGNDDIEPTIGQVEGVDDNRFQINGLGNTGHQTVSVDEITAGRTLLFATRASAVNVFKIRLEKFAQIKVEKKHEQLKAAKIRLGIKLTP